MTPLQRKWLQWTPRVLAILFVLFLNVFALNVFAKSKSFWLLLAALLLHSIPTLIVIASLVVAWRWELAGGILFLLQSAGYAFESRHRPSSLIAFAGPVFLIGVLFIIDWHFHKKSAKPAADPRSDDSQK